MPTGCTEKSKVPASQGKEIFYFKVLFSICIKEGEWRNWPGRIGSAINWYYLNGLIGIVLPFISVRNRFLKEHNEITRNV